MRIWRSLDLLGTVTVSLAVGVLGMVNLTDSTVVSGVTLAALGVLATGTLGARLQLRGLSAASAELTELTRRHLTEPPPAGRLLRASTSGVDVDLAGAAEIGLIGVTLNRTVRNHAAALGQCLRRGGTVRVAVIDPGGDVLAEAARRSTAPDAARVFAHRVRPTLDLLAGLAAAQAALRRN